MNKTPPRLFWILLCSLLASLSQTTARGQGAAFTYQDTDLLLVFRKDGASDVLFNLGTVSNYLGQANGLSSAVTSVDAELLHAVYGPNLTGVTFALAATTPVLTDGTPLRVWLSDSDPSVMPTDETFSRWSVQRSKVTSIGTAATSYSTASNQSLVLPANDPGSYTFIASDGGLLEPSTLGGASPFAMEVEVGKSARLIELHVSGVIPKPPAVQVGNFAVAADGSVTFTAGILAPVIVSGPSSLEAACGVTASLSVNAAGVKPLSYQWFKGEVAVEAATASSLTFDPVVSANAGSYAVVVSNAGGSVTSAPVTLTVTDTTPPELTLPSGVLVTRTSNGGAPVSYSASANDACVGPVAIVCTPPSGSVFPVGVTAVTCVADDGNGNTNSGSFGVTVQDIVLTVTNVIYSAYRTDLTAGSYVYVDSDVEAATPVRATQRSLGYREVSYKSTVPGTLFFAQASPTTNGTVIAYDYSSQADKTNIVGFWVNKDVPMVIGPDGNAYITDGHHTTAGYLDALSPVREIIPGKRRVILGHIVANLYDSAHPTAPDDTWWLARAAENNAYLYGVDGNALTLPADPGYAGLQPILPSVLAMPSTPSAIGAGAMFNSAYRSLTWGLADAILLSAVDGSGKKIAGYKKSAPGSSVDINFVEFYWADFLRNRIVWDNTKTGSPYGSPNDDASVIAAPMSFFAAVANGTAMAKSESYTDQYGRKLSEYTNSSLFGPNTVNWANGSLSNGLAAAKSTYNLYILDDSGFVGAITPSVLSTNILHVDTVAGMTLSNTLVNFSSIFINGGARLVTSWKDATVSNSTLRIPAGSGTVTFTGSAAAGATVISNGVLLVQGTLGTGAVTVAHGTLGGTGTIAGSVNVLASGVLAPGASLGTLTVNGALTLSGTVQAEVDRGGSTISSDQVVGISTLTYGGTLALTATGNHLTSGDVIKLFDAASYRGSFTAFNLPALNGGLEWDSSMLTVDGSLRVVAGGAATLSIVTQPASQVVDAGATATLIGGAGGTLPITYQWSFNGAAIGGATSSSLVLASVHESDQGEYQLVASNASGSVTSAPAVLTINQAPLAQGQSVTLPWNASVNISLVGSDPDGDALTFTVTTAPTHGTLTGTAPALTYQAAAGYTGPDSLVFRVSDGRVSATATVNITVQPGFTYTDTDLLLVFRKEGFSDLLFNLGTVSNYLGKADGFTAAVTNVNASLLHGVFGADLSGLKYAVVGATAVATDGTPLRAWLSDADPNGNPSDETFSRWSVQRGKIAAIGSAAAAYPNSSNQSLVLPATDPGSYTFIASDGGLLEVSTLGGASPFPVEIELPGNARLIELRVSAANPKPLAVQVGNFTLSVEGTLTFTAGVLAPVIVSGPSDQTAPCGGTATFSVVATGVNPRSYQWRHGGADIEGATSSSLTIETVTSSSGGSYSVVVHNAGGSTTSGSATLFVTDPVTPLLSITHVETNLFKVSWPQSDCRVYTLEETHELSAPGTIWSTVVGAPVAEAGSWQVLVLNTTNTLYRLRSP